MDGWIDGHLKTFKETMNNTLHLFHSVFLGAAPLPAVSTGIVLVKITNAKMQPVGLRTGTIYILGKENNNSRVSFLFTTGCGFFLSNVSQLH